jgi:penicillin-binding protein 1A
MKKCYADQTLNISLEDFEQPENLTINIDCGKNSKVEEDEEIIEVTPEEDLDF